MCKTCGCHNHPLEEQVLQVTGMTCGHCKDSVEKAVRSLPGVLHAEVDLEAKTLKVQFDHHKSTLQDIKEAVENIGFDVA